MADAPEPPKRDLAQGVALAELADGAIVAGRVGDDDVIVLKRGDDVFAVGAHCTHYHGPLAEGLVVGDTVRCPWHHAEFCLRTGEALRAPALDPIACYRVERSGERVVVHGKLEAPRAPSRAGARHPGIDRHRRRRRGRTGGRRHAAPARLRRRADDAVGRRFAAGRPSQSFQGLSRRQRARRLDTAARTRLTTRSAASISCSVRASARSTLRRGA